MSSDQIHSVPLTVGTPGQEAAANGIMTSYGEPSRQVGGCRGLQRTASKDMGFAFPEGTSGNAPQSGGLGLQRTMSKDMGGKDQQTLPGGGLQRTMSRDMGGAQPGGLQRTMSRDLGAGPHLGGLQRTMSRDLGNSQPSSGGLQRTMSRGLGNSAAPRDSSRLPRKTQGKGDRVPRSAGGQDPLPRHAAPIS